MKKSMDAYANEKKNYKKMGLVSVILNHLIIGKKLEVKIYQNMNYLLTLWFELDLFYTPLIFRRIIS